MATNNPHLPTDKGIILKGVAWTTGYRVFATFAQFGAMLVLVRIIPPEEYGRAGAVVGVLTILNVLSCRAFFSQALQLPKGEEPDWTMHWRAGLWFVPSHRSIATLLHLASLGILIECPSTLRSTMLQRALDFPRLRILDGISKTFSILTMLSLGVAGFGALAIVAGANVIPAIPGAIDLLLVHRFRPRSGWFKFLDWRRYKASLLFGFQQSWSGLLQSLRGALEAAVLPLQLGFAALGLLQRAQSLFLATVGQVNSIFAETVYPLLPKHAAEPERYRNTATLFLQVVFWIVLPGAVFVAWQGKAALRVLYGERWIAADPLIAPGAVIGAAGLSLRRRLQHSSRKDRLEALRPPRRHGRARHRTPHPHRHARWRHGHLCVGARRGSAHSRGRGDWDGNAVAPTGLAANRARTSPRRRHRGGARIARHPWPRELAAHRPTAMPRIPLPLHHGSRHPRTLP